MADTSSSQDKTEEATPKRLRDARKQGDVWQSQDLSTTVSIVFFALLAIAGAKPAMAWLVQELGEALVAATRPETDVLQQVRHLLLSVGLWAIGGAVAAILISSLASGLQVRGVLSFDRVTPDLQRLNPIEGLKRIFAWHTVIELLRLLIKLLALAITLWVLARQLLPLLAQAQHVPLQSWLLIGGQQMQSLLGICCVVFGVVALADFAYQRWRYLREKRMSQEEVKREYKEREGDPILRGRRKHLHQEIVFSDMLHQVRKSSVVIVNPTHIAVALRYDAKETPLPMVVAKGEGEVARAIREAALQAGVPIYRDISLARKLHGETPVNDYIPDDLLEAVAQVLRWVERMKRQEDGPQGLQHRE
jgi:type III secretion protein U